MPNALLERPAFKTPPATRDGNTPLPHLRRLCERTANKVAQILRSPDSLPAIVNAGNCATDAAIASPDVYLIHAPEGAARLDWAQTLVGKACTAGQRILVLANGSNSTTLAQSLHQQGHAAILCGLPDGVPAEGQPLTERRRAEQERAEECREWEAEVNRAAERLEGLEADQRRHREFREHHTALQKELAELEHAAACPSGGLGGFVKKLFGGGKPTDLPQRTAALRDQLQNLIEPASVDAEALEQAAAAHRLADAEFARAIARPIELSAASVANTRIAVTTADALLTSRLLAEDAPRFDRLIVLDGEDLDESVFMAAASRAEAWVLLGNPEADGYFTYLWMHLHKPGPWIALSDRRLYRLMDSAPDRVEALADRPEIELQFSDGELATIAFPATMDVSEAEEFVARELGEVAPERPSRTAVIA